MTIIDAAVDTFAKKGFHDTNVSEIAARAGVSQGTIYLYYESKQELLRAVELRLFEKLARPMLERLQENQSSAARRLRDTAAQALDSFVDHQELV